MRDIQGRNLADDEVLAIEYYSMQYNQVKNVTNTQATYLLPLSSPYYSIIVLIFLSLIKDLTQCVGASA